MVAKSAQSIVTDDAREAYEVFRHVRNFVFVLFMISLFVLNTCFWIVDRGCVDDVLGFAPACQRVELVEAQAGQEGWWWADETAPAEPAVPPGHPDSTRPERGSPNLEAQPMFPEDAPFGAPAPRIESEPPAPLDGQPGQRLVLLRDLIRLLVRLCNVVMPLLGVFYCLLLLIGMKLVIVGRLGGLADTAQAFFISLLLMLLVVPWARTVSAEAPVALFTWQELVRDYQRIGSQSDFVGLTLYYGKYVGVWLVALFLLILAFGRSCRAAKAMAALHEAVAAEASDQAAAAAGDSAMQA